MQIVLDTSAVRRIIDCDEASPLATCLESLLQAGVLIRVPDLALFELLEQLAANEQAEAHTEKQLTWAKWDRGRHLLLALVTESKPIAVELERPAMFETLVGRDGLADAEERRTSEVAFYREIWQALVASGHPASFEAQVNPARYPFLSWQPSRLSQLAQTFKTSRLRGLPEQAYALRNQGLAEGKTEDEMAKESYDLAPHPLLAWPMARLMRSQRPDRNVLIDAPICGFSEINETIVLTFDVNQAKHAGAYAVLHANGGIPPTWSDVIEALAAQVAKRTARRTVPA